MKLGLIPGFETFQTFLWFVSADLVALPLNYSSQQRPAWIPILRLPPAFLSSCNCIKVYMMEIYITQEKTGQLQRSQPNSSALELKIMFDVQISEPKDSWGTEVQFQLTAPPGSANLAPIQGGRYLGLQIGGTGETISWPVRWVWQSPTGENQPVCLCVFVNAGPVQSHPEELGLGIF